MKLRTIPYFVACFVALGGSHAIDVGSTNHSVDANTEIGKPLLPGEARIGAVIVDRNAAGEPLRTGRVFDGSPAAKAGIKSECFLISINGTNVVSASMKESMSLMIGPSGTTVTLELADPTRTQTNKLTVKRAPILGWSDAGPRFQDGK